MTTSARHAGPVPTGPEDVAPRYTHKQILEILAGLLLAMFTSMISTTVVGTALPTIVGELGGQDQLSWVASATILAMTVSTPLWGKLSDVFGRKRIFQIALVLFVVASAAAGLSQNMGQLIAARAVQGLGAGGLQALTQVILGDVVEPRERGRYSGYLGAVFGISTVAGPLLGGFLVDADALGWRACFYVSIPLAVVAFAVIQKVLHLPRVKRDTRIDWLGAFLVTGAAGSFMLWLSLGGQEFAWGSGWTVLLVTAAVVFGIAAVLVERRSAAPILPPRLFTNRTVVLTIVASLFVGVAMFGVMIYLPQYLQIAKGMSPTASGLMTVPMVVAMFTTSMTSGQLISRFGRWKVYPVVGTLLVAIGLLLLSRLHVDTSHLVFGLDIAVIGLGLGLTMQVLVLAAQNAVPRSDLATTTASVTFFRSLGGAVGIAAFGAVLTNRLAAEITSLLAERHIALPPGAGGSVHLGTPSAIHALPGPLQDVVLEAFTRALHAVFLLGVPAALIAFVAVVAMPELVLRTGRAAAEPAAEPAAAGTGDDVLFAGLVLALVAERADRLSDDSALAQVLARLVPDRPGRVGERAAFAARTIVRPTAAALLRYATGGAASAPPPAPRRHVRATAVEPAETVYPN